ncbi:GntR family transcriptional regulator [Saccharopolyspora cebuensis]|uniref:GntR family transcriptional regulator n=1 Tax=Saccharopolyspora cebuensis TaxID=418759 RepID=A0ABV4CDI6_9PSEU
MTDRNRVRPARRRGLAEEVADRIRDAIFSGAYAPGAQLRETELSAALDVSRGPVREALVRLEREGLVRSAWHRGATVTELTPDDVGELDSLRGALEQLAVREVLARAEEPDLAAVDDAVRAMERAATPHEMVACDIAFHDALYAAAHHRRLTEAWQAIREQVHLFLLTRVNRSSEGYLAHVPAEHRGLLAALRAGDAESALDLFADHRRHAFEVLSDEAPRISSARRGGPDR